MSGGASVVYFLRRADGEGPIKIGSTRDLTRRFAGLAHWMPYPLTILATMPGDSFLERRFHAKFAGQHSHCEWFHPSPELLRIVADVGAGTLDVADLPEPRDLCRVRGPWSEDRKLGGRIKAQLRALAQDCGREAIPRSIWTSAKSLMVEDDARRADAIRVVSGFLELHGGRLDRKAA